MTREGSGRLQLRSLAEVQARQVRWLDQGFIPFGTLTLVAGAGGLGKSTWLAGVAARLSTGVLTGSPADTIIVSFEDTAEEILRPRLEAAGGDLRHVHDVIVSGGGIDAVELPRDIEELCSLTRGVQARLVIIDPIVAALDASIDAHKDQHVRRVLAHLTRIAEEEHCAIVMVGHLNKAATSDAYIRVANSVAFWNAARSVILITEDVSEPENHRLIAQRKTNWARMRPVERHRIEEILLPETLDPETGEPLVTSRMVFVEVAAEIEATDVLVQRPPTETRESGAADFLLAELADGKWHLSAQIKEKARRANISVRTLQRAAKDLEIEDKREGMPSVTFWRRPQLRQVSPPGDGATGCDNPATSKPSIPPVAPSVTSEEDGATE
jgi:KaiC/GvpD/RAD55 family RecA-like ATPase